MKNIYFCFVLMFCSIASVAQNVNFGAWYLNVNSSFANVNKLNPGYFNSDTPPDNFDFVPGTDYTFNGKVTVGSGSGISVRGTLYLRLIPSLASTGTYFNIKLADIPSGSTDFQINNTTVNWNGQLQNFVASVNFPIIGYLFFEESTNSVPFTARSLDYITLTRRNPLTVTAPNASYACGAAPVQLSASVAGGTGALQYAWSPAKGLSATNIYNPKASPSATTQYTVTVTDAGNPIAQVVSKVVTVTYVPLAAPVVSGSNTFFNPCPGTTASYTYSVSTIPASVTSVTWSMTGLTSGLSMATASSPIKPNATVSGSGPVGNTFNISCVYSNATCTSSPTVVNVTFASRTCQLCTNCKLCPTAPGCGTPAVAAAMTNAVIYPNPVTNKSFALEFSVEEEGSYLISIVDSQGSLVASRELESPLMGLREESFSLPRAGVYYVKVIQPSGISSSQRVVVN